MGKGWKNIVERLFPKKERVLSHIKEQLIGVGCWGGRKTKSSGIQKTTGAVDAFNIYGLFCFVSGRNVNKEDLEMSFLSWRNGTYSTNNPFLINVKRNTIFRFLLRNLGWLTVCYSVVGLWESHLTCLIRISNRCCKLEELSHSLSIYLGLGFPFLYIHYIYHIDLGILPVFNYFGIISAIC